MTRSACSRRLFCRIRFGTRSKKTFQASVLVATDAAPRCNGMARIRPGFRTLNPGCQWPTTFVMKMWTCFRKDKGSLYWLYRRLIDFRRKHVALTEGSYKPLKASGDLLLFCRELREERLLIALNMGPEPIAVSFPDEKIVWACCSIFIFRP